MPNTSNRQLWGILVFALLLLFGLMAWELHVHGRFAGLIIGIYLVPALFVLSLMLARLLGPRKVVDDGEQEEKDG